SSGHKQEGNFPTRERALAGKSPGARTASAGVTLEAAGSAHSRAGWGSEERSPADRVPGRATGRGKVEGSAGSRASWPDSSSTSRAGRRGRTGTPGPGDAVPVRTATPHELSEGLCFLDNKRIVRRCHEATQSRGTGDTLRGRNPVRPQSRRQYSGRQE